MFETPSGSAAVVGFGIPAMDAADRRIYALLDVLDREIAEDRSGPVLGGVFDRIRREAMLHFSFEEQFFERIRHHGARDHAVLHRKIIAHFETFHEELVRTEIRRTRVEYARIVRQTFDDHTLLERQLYSTGEPGLLGRRTSREGTRGGI
jgi:hemerythrin